MPHSFFPPSKIDAGCHKRTHWRHKSVEEHRTPCGHETTRERFLGRLPKEEPTLDRFGFEWEGAYADDYRAPKAKGIWVDYNPLLGKRGRMWELNRAGRAVRRVMNAISPWLSCAGVLCVVRKGAERG